MTAREGSRVVARNRKALHDYHIEDKYEAGLVLTGTEIKSIREGSVNLRDGYVRPRDGELWLLDVH
ncbi:MAG: SsrA-binding protein, partial [Anaerolineae bacterium]